MAKNLLMLFVCFMLVLCSFSLPANTATAVAEPVNELTAAFEAGYNVMTKGPAPVQLKDQASIAVPDGFGFIPAAESGRILKAMGNRPGEAIVGMIFPLNDEEDYFFVISYEDAGYIKDDDAKDWNADDLLKSIREGTEQSNEDRRKMNIPEMEVVGWVEKPAYDAATHQLVWSLESKNKGETDAANHGVNYNTLVLGRHGYMSMNLVAGLTQIEQLKPTAKTMLNALTFNEGKRYADFNASTDKVAEYGLAALVAGVAAKKLGFFAVIAAVLAKSAKVIILAVAAAGGVIFKFFKRNKE